MRLFLIATLVFLSSCFNVAEMPILQSLTMKRQKQKVIALQKKLESAEKEQKKVLEEVEKLSAEINDVQLALIRKQVNEAEKKKTPSLFLAEREILYEIIQSGPSTSAFEAQVELDRILRVITELSDDGKHG